MQRLVLFVCSAFVAASAIAGEANWRKFASQGETVFEGNTSTLDLSGIFPTMWVRARYPARDDGAVRTVGQYEFDCDESEMRLMSEQTFDADGELLYGREIDEDEGNWKTARAGTFGADTMRYVCDAEASMEE